MPARSFFASEEYQYIEDLSRRTEPRQNPPQPQTLLTRRFVLSGISGLFMLIALFVFLQPESGQPEIQQFGRMRAIQLDVQNGSGEPKLAQKVTDFLRAEGFDVVELGNYRQGNVQQTLVIDRIGNPEAARSVAKALGVAEEKVVQQIDKNLFLDATVVVGKDFTKLKAFK